MRLHVLGPGASFDAEVLRGTGQSVFDPRRATSWARQDIARMAWNPRNIAYLDSKHTMGFGVR